jgi:UDP-N-acetylglucosamine 2-epimerase
VSSNHQKQLALCYGTRPQVIKAARLLPALRRRWRVLSVDTGQHYDFALNGGLYQELDVPAPDLFLGVGPGHPVEQTARMSAACTQALLAHQPDLVVVIGDTNSTLACALAASQLRIPLVHVEAGLRSGDLAMAEERNRRTVDALANLLCAPSALAMDTLGGEGLGDKAVLTGDVSRDVLGFALGRVDRAGEPPLPAAPYLLATLHRAELVDAPELLRAAVEALGRCEYPVLFPAHPRTRAMLGQANLLERLPANIDLRPPLGYLDNLAAIRGAAAVVTDSGGVQREAYWLGTPCVTVRNETEWPETTHAGANNLVAPGAVDTIPLLVRQLVHFPPAAWDASAYGCGDAGERIAAAITALFGHSHTA